MFCDFQGFGSDDGAIPTDTTAPDSGCAKEWIGVECSETSTQRGTGAQTADNSLTSQPMSIYPTLSLTIRLVSFGGIDSCKTARFSSELLMSGAVRGVRRLLTTLLLGNTELQRRYGAIVPVVEEYYFEPGEEETLEVEFTGLQLVDTESADWEQIRQIRCDENARRKLRNVRLFFWRDFRNASPDYIKDALSQKIDEYESACRKHGFAMLDASISVLFDSKSLLGFAAVAAAALLTGQTGIASAAAVSGAAMEIGKLAMTFARKTFEFQSVKENQELAYLYHLRKKLGDS